MTILILIAAIGALIRMAALAIYLGIRSLRRGEG